ncbi:hypothetical protein F4859DRAFT_508272 [Xylaria cf. heliscus]|nr:hypothetical protein F4859DRAFT_508272 [Xylaria cf. heliscus]
MRCFTSSTRSPRPFASSPSTGSVAAGPSIAMFLLGGLSQGGLNARDAGNLDSANEFGAAAVASIVVSIYTFIFFVPRRDLPSRRPNENPWSVESGTLTLALPYIIDSISEKMFCIFGAVNVVGIPIVFTLDPTRGHWRRSMFFAADAP